MNSRFSIVHNGPVAYALTIEAARSLRDFLQTQGYVIIDSHKYVFTHKLTIYDSVADKNVE